MGITKKEQKEWAVDYRTKNFIRILREEVKSSDGLRNMADFSDYRFNEGIKEGLELASYLAENAGGDE